MRALSTSLAAFALSLSLLVGCSKGSSSEEPSSEPAATYTARGLVREVNRGDTAQVVIFHEAIDDFRDNSGKVVGMNAMPMPFAPARGLSLEGIAPGQKVSFTFEVRWKEEPRLRLTRIDALPAETALAIEEDGAHAHH